MGDCITLLLIMFISRMIGNAHGQTDPCITYQPLNDTTLLTSYSSSSPICTAIGSPGWYRYIASADGTIADTCPYGNQCGTNKQIWMNGDVNATTTTSTTTATTTTTTITTMTAPSRSTSSSSRSSTPSSTLPTTTTNSASTTKIQTEITTVPGTPTQQTGTGVSTAEASHVTSSELNVTYGVTYDAKQCPTCTTSGRAACDLDIDPCAPRRIWMITGTVIFSVIDCLLVVAIVYLNNEHSRADSVVHTDTNFKSKFVRNYVKDNSI